MLLSTMTYEQIYREIKNDSEKQKICMKRYGEIIDEFYKYNYIN